MKYTQLGTTGVHVSPLCFGTMSFGGDANEAESARMFHACRDKGINFYDCADGYSRGAAEKILGKLMKGCRDELVVTSKCVVPMGDDVNARGANRRHIIQAVEASLQRMGTDRLDVLFMHRWDQSVPLEETLRALEKLVSDGKIMYIGASNYAAWQVALGLGLSEKHGWPRIDVIQPMYSLVKRQAESEIFPLALNQQLGVMTYSPVGGGLLSGKYAGESKPDAGRLISNKEYNRRYGEDWVYEVAQQFSDYAKQNNIHPVTLAVAWAAANPAVTCPIIGARSLEQLKPSLDALDIELSSEMYAEITRLSRTPPPATDRLEEQINL